MVNIVGYETKGILHRSRSRVVYRAVRKADGVPVVLKTSAAEYPTRHAVAELRHELAIAQRLRSIEGVIRVHGLEPHGHGNVALVLEPFGRSLAEELASAERRRLSPELCLSIAISVAETLGRMHQLDVVHKGIQPGALLWDAARGVRIIDFTMSSELSRERQSGAVTRQAEVALPYISPEQTGRMNRDLDYRTDFYSLGVTLFQLLTGELPFRATTVLEWVHSHIGKRPRSPREIDASLPEPLAEVVLRLLAKNAEDRYQSSFGLIDDLERCRRELAQTGSVSQFALGRRDVSQRFRVPQRLYGREGELSALSALCDGLGRGGPRVCMVSGYSGIGKSALVNELGKSLVRDRGYLIQGKFDQLQRGTPYSAVATAFRGLVTELLSEPDDRIAAFRESVLAAVSPNAGLLVELVPELALLLGPQPPVPELPRAEAQNRFQLVLTTFVKVITTERPLVIFLDDLQFGDAPTLGLLRRLVTTRDLGRLLVIGAYRSNEVDGAHLLRAALNEIRETNAVMELPLAPLSLSAAEALVADTLHVDPAACRELSVLLHDRAQGNPFFLTEMLHTLEQERAITFSPEVGHWTWTLEAVRRSGVSSTLAEFVVANLRKLAPPTQRVLELAACIGNTFDLRTLAIIHERSMDETADELLPALQRHLVVPLDEDYKLAGRGAVAGGPREAAAAAGGVNPTYRFQHDQVQQAAYALIEPDRRQALHLSIGRLMLRHASEEEREQRVIDIVGHLDEGRRHITDPAERLDLARRNLEAGLVAERAAAYEAAVGYLNVGLELLPPDRWSCAYELTMALSTEYQQCAYWTGRYEEAEAWLEQMLEHARSDLERAEILAMRTRQYATTGRMEDSIRAAIKGLHLLGIRVTDDPDQRVVRRERLLVKRNLAGRRIEDLIAQPVLTDPKQKVAIRLLMEIFPAAFLSGSGNLFPLLVLKSVNISLRHGSSPESAFAYAAYGMLLCGALDEPALGYEFGKLAVRMNERFDDIPLKSRVLYVYAMFVHHWSNHWSTMTPWFRRGIEAGYQSGDLLYLAYSAQDCIIWDPRLDLETAEREHAEYLKIVRDCEYQDSLDSGTLFLQLQRNLLGATSELCSLNDATFDEERCLAGMRRRRFMTGVANYHIYKMEIARLYGRYEEAMVHVREQDQLVASSMALPQIVRYYLAAFLIRAACLPGMEEAERVLTERRLREDLARVARWAAHCPENFAHLELLMRAELARLEGRVDRALGLYDQAIEAARASEFLRDEATGNELAARHLIAAGRPKSAEGYLRAAHHLYERWGARRKVEHLELEFSEVLSGAARGARPSLRAADIGAGTSTIDSASLDLASVMKASQAISSEIVLEQLWSTTMRIMLENAGGERGCFVLQREGQLVFEGRSEVGTDEAPARGVPIASADAALALPMSIVYHVIRTNSPVVLHAADRAGVFARDPYLVARRPQSVACVPLVRQGRFEGAIYMENGLTSGVFTEDRIEVVKLLAAQVSISLENAKLYEDQTRLIEAQRRFVPSQFLESLDHRDIARVDLGEHVAKEMSIMFADLRGFTPLAERIGPRAIIEVLNRYFVCMEAPIAEAGGFIDSFAGDEIKALFDASADAAVRAGVGMWRALDVFNERARASGQPELGMGIGVNTGPVVLGTVGARERIQCSVIGDAVNLASRIEQLTKVYRARLLIGEHTFRSLRDPGSLCIRKVDRVAVKGKDTAVELYEVLDAEPPGRREAKRRTHALLQSAMSAYVEREFEHAQAEFRRMAAEDPEDAVPGIFADRCAIYRATPPASDWDGFERLTSK